MPAPILSPIALFLLLLLSTAPAVAACTDSPAPGVDWRRCLQDGRDLQHADLTGAVLRDTSFTRGRLQGATLAKADAPSARFVSADAAGADFSGAVLRGADFTRARLAGARFVGADLRGARFFRADLTDADLSEAVLAGADLSTATLDGALWVDGHRRCAAGSVGSCQ